MHALLFVALLAPAAEPDNPVLDAAMKRQEAIKSIEFVLKVSEVIEKGGESTSPPTPGEKLPKLPAQQTTRNWSERLVLDGKRSRWEKGSTVMVCDGTTAKETGQVLPSQPMPGIRIRPSDGSECSRIYHSPVEFTARGTTPTGWAAQIELGSLTRTGEIEFSVAEKRDYPATKVWASQDEDYAVRRVWVEPKAKREAPTIDIRNAKHSETVLWLPESWESVLYFDDGTPRKRWRVTVEKVTVNATWPDSEFDIPYTPGMLVHDYRDESLMLVRDDGTIRPFTRGVDDVPPPPPPTPPGWVAEHGPWVLAVGCVLLVVGWLLARRVLRRSSRDPEGIA